jgi:hypothetical protein
VIRRNRRKVGAIPQSPLVLSARDRGALETRAGDSWMALVEDVRFVWWEAQMEASLAYHHWCRMSDRTAYASYRAAQDQADAAQDALSARHASKRTRGSSAA